MMLVTFALLVAQDPMAQPSARLLITTAAGATTTKDYSTVELCEAARERVTAYNRRRTTEELRRQRGDSIDHLEVKAVCLPI
ncbi:hypothetical protein [Sphingomonas koreensis]|nr:hypothetical protein [Sphingomonas koreensis]